MYIRYIPLVKGIRKAQVFPLYSSLSARERVVLLSVFTKHFLNSSLKVMCSRSQIVQVPPFFVAKMGLVIPSPSGYHGVNAKDIKAPTESAFSFSSQLTSLAKAEKCLRLQHISRCQVLTPKPPDQMHHSQLTCF